MIDNIGVWFPKIKADLQFFLTLQLASISAPTCSAFWTINCCYLESDYVKLCEYMDVHYMFTRGVNEVAHTPLSGSPVEYVPLPVRVMMIILMVSRGDGVTSYIVP